VAPSTSGGSVPQAQSSNESAENSPRRKSFLNNGMMRPSQASQGMVGVLPQGATPGIRPSISAFLRAGWVSSRVSKNFAQRGPSGWAAEWVGGQSDGPPRASPRDLSPYLKGPGLVRLSVNRTARPTPQGAAAPLRKLAAWPVGEPPNLGASRFSWVRESGD
jgi:hypothetical protein